MSSCLGHGIDKKRKMVKAIDLVAQATQQQLSGLHSLCTKVAY